MSFFGKPSGGEPRITYERIDLSAAPDEADAGELRAAEHLEPKSERPKVGAPPLAPSAGIMLVAADSEVEGRLRGRGVVRVEGVLRGSLQAPVVLIEAGGLLEGAVTAERVRISGTLRGTITAREIEIVRTAMVHAELVYDEISIERGARVSGVHKQREPEPEPAEAPPAPPPPAAQEATAPAVVADPVVLATAAVSTAALVAEAEAALSSLAQVTQAAAEAVADLADGGVTELVTLEVELRATPEQLLAPGIQR